MRTRILACALLACAGGFLAGCKGNASAAASLERATGKPPAVRATFASGDFFESDPVHNPVWKNAHWTRFTSPANTSRSTAPTDAAILFDAENLYVAFISEQQLSQGEGRLDNVSLFLNNTGADKELFQISFSATGATSCAWYRSSSPAMPLDDGSPNFSHATNVHLNVVVPDLRCAMIETQREQRPVWTAVMGVPLRALPPVFWKTPAEGQHWKVNLLRTIATIKGGKRVDMLQSNLSPVFIDAQPVSPYRLADLTFEPAAK